MSKKELEEKEEVEEVATEEATEEKVEAPEAEEATEEVKEDADESIEETAEKLASLITQKVNEAASRKEASPAKKAKVFADDAEVKTVDSEHEVYTKKDGTKVTMKTSEITHLGNWFKHAKDFAVSKRPDAFASMQEEYNALEKMAVSQKLEPLNTTTAAEGGNLVPTILFNELIPLIEDQAVIRPNSRVLDMRGVKTLSLPGVASKPYTSWNSEGSQKATTSAEFSSISLTPYILAGIMVLSEQLIDDSPFNVVQIVSQLLAEAIAKEEDRAFINGSGVGQPTGISTYTPGYTISAGGAYDWTHLNAAYFGLPQGHRASQRCVWIMNSKTLATTANMVDDQSRPILDLSGALTGAGLPTIRGKRVLEQNDLSDNTILLVDLNWYWIGYSRSMSIDMSRETTVRSRSVWERNEVAIRAEEKVDGELVTTRALATITAVRS